MDSWGEILLPNVDIDVDVEQVVLHPSVTAPVANQRGRNALDNERAAPPEISVEYDGLADAGYDRNLHEGVSFPVKDLSNFLSGSGAPVKGGASFVSGSGGFASKERPRC